MYVICLSEEMTYVPRNLQNGLKIDKMRHIILNNL